MDTELISVESLLMGFTLVHYNLTIYKEDHVVINSRNDSSDHSQVKLISGGGSGHEPAHVGFVGNGMLTTVVCGEMFSSPSVQHILNAILVTGSPNTSILLIVKNYTGDRLNFGLALEVARNRYNYQNIDMVIINDDISIDDNKVHKSVGRRGLAGTVFYHKIMGALAAKHKTLQEIVTYVNRLLANNIICSIGFTYERMANVTTGIRNIEIGKGIHGEPGVEFINKLENFQKIYKILLEKFQVKIPKTSNVILMVNNLGGSSQYMMNIFLNQVYTVFSEVYKIVKIYSGCFLTSLNSEGFSLTLINLSDPKNLVDIIDYLEYETSVPCNIFELNVKSVINDKCVIRDRIELSKVRSDKLSLNSKFENDQIGTLFKIIIGRCSNELIQNCNLLNQIDSEFGDGDTGTTLSCFAKRVELEMKNGDLKTFTNPKMILMQLAEIAQTIVGGTTGALYSLFLEGLSMAIKDGETVNRAVWASGLKEGISTIMKYAHAQKGDRTLLEPLIACDEELNKYTGMENLNNYCKASVEATINMIPKSGRAAYTFSMNKQLHKTNFPDPGAKGVGILINVIAEEILNFK